MTNATRLLRVVRLDDSDTQVYERAAAPGEWAVPGTFHFWDLPVDALQGKTRQAFAHGFLGLSSFGRATLVAVAPITPAELEAAAECLAAHLVEAFGAPNLAAALPAAREEIAFAAELCQHPPNTLVAVARQLDGDDIDEQFKVVTPPSGANHDAIALFGVVDDDQAP
ncbi:MAG: DUF6505 family protein [Candidatus Competibacterales bacterium]